MKNKTKQWRKVNHQVNPATGLLERYGKRFRDAMRSMGPSSAGVPPVMIGLMKRAGISTPVFDEYAKMSYNKGYENEGETDAVV